jgi:O-antigen/teichoic acid export membrane protein
VPVLRAQRAQSGDLRALLSFGAWITVSNLIAPFLVFWDRFVIGAMLGPAAVAIYVIPFNLVWQTSMVPNALTSALYPRLAAAKLEERRRLISRALKVTSVLMTPGMILAEIVVGPFLNLWIGPTRGALAAPIASVLFFGIWANSFALVPAAHLEAQGRPDILARLHLLQILPYGIALYFLVKTFGPLGAAYAWTVRCGSDPLVLSAVVKDRLPPTFLAEALLLIAAIAVNLWLPMSTPWHWGALVILLGIGTGLVLIRQQQIVAEGLSAFGDIVRSRTS